MNGVILPLARMTPPAPRPPSPPLPVMPPAPGTLASPLEAMGSSPVALASAPPAAVPQGPLQGALFSWQPGQLPYERLGGTPNVLSLMQQLAQSFPRRRPPDTTVSPGGYGPGGGVPSGWGGAVPSGDIIDRVAMQKGEASSELLRIAKAIMMAESGGNPSAVNPNEGSAGLFQIHPIHGIPLSMRLDPWFNASWALDRIIPAYRQGLARGLRGEELVRYVYDRAINPGGGWAWQGDKVLSWYWRIS